MRPAFRSAVLAAALLTAAPAPALAGPPAAPPPQGLDEAKEMFRHIVGIPTVAGRGKVPEMAAYVAARFKAAGWSEQDIRIMPHGETASLIVRWPAIARGKPQKGILLLGHMDVVEAKREDWTTDPFILVEQDGYYYGRGTTDMKSGITAVTQALINLRRSGFKPRRDIVVLFTGDEEAGGAGAELGASEWRSVTGPIEYGLNADAGGISYDDADRPIGASVQTAEKTYTNYVFTVRNRGGHSSRPRKDNAIYQLARALERLEAYRFEPMMNETTRAYFEARQKGESGPLGDAMRRWLADPKDGAAADIIEANEQEVGLTRTRCVATQLEAGHAKNALPQTAKANVNCRLFPGVSPDAVREELEKVVVDKEVTVTRDDDYRASLASPLRADVMAAFRKAVAAVHPGMDVSAHMSTGATDARPFRESGVPVYGVRGEWTRSPSDMRMHGKDERLPVDALGHSIRHWEVMVRETAGK